MCPAIKPEPKKADRQPAGGNPGQAAPQAKKRPISMKISKNTYVFDVKRKISVSRRFKMRPAQEGFGKIMSALPIGQGAHAAPKPAPSPAAVKKPGAKQDGAGSRPIYDSDIAKKFSKNAEKKNNPFLGIAKKAFGGFLVIGLFFIILLLLVLPPAIPEQPMAPNVTVPSFTAQFPDLGVATYGSESAEAHTVYAMGSYSSANLDYSELSLRVYDQPIPTQVFVLSGQKSNADSYPDFRRGLDKYLGQEGLSVSDLDPEYLDRLPANSVLIVPTGYLPASLLGYTSSNLTFNDLIDRGVVVLYIGLRFDKYYMDDKGSIPTPDPARLDSMGIRFQPMRTDYSPQEINMTSIFDPTYEVVSSQRPSKVIFGAVSVITGKNGGAFMAVPQTLDTGWSSDGDLAAKDVSMMVSQFVWLTPVASAYQSISLNGSNNGTFFIYTSPYKNEGQYARFVSTATSNETGEKIGYGKNFVVWQRQSGELYSRSGVEALSSYITNLPISLSADFRNPAGGMKNLFIRTSDSDGVVIPSLSITRDPINLGGIQQFDYMPDLDPGVYLLSIVDSQNNIYAKTVLVIPDINITVAKKDFAKGNFQFTVNSGASEKVRMTSASVSMNGKDEKIYSLTDTLDYSTGPLNAGNYTFEITVGPHQGKGITRSIVLPYVIQKSFWDDPYFLGLAALAAIIFGAAFFLRIPEKEMFGLDIPDFPPIANIKIPIKQETVVNLFRQVNKDYSWEYMPLKLSEVKNAFRKLAHNGKSIIIGDYNLERILDRIEKTGFVFENYGLYGLSEWAGQSGKPPQYLCMFRQLRDIFVNSAVRFSPMLESEDYDIKFIAGQEVYVHIFDSKSDVVAKAFGTVPLGLTVIVFEREIEMEKFFSSLSSTQDMKISLKMELYQNRLRLVTIGKFQDLIKEIKPT